MATLKWLIFLIGGISLILDSCGACLFGSSADCVFRCHCANNAACDVTTGQCPGQCEAGLPQPSDDVTRYDWRGPACQIGNVALNKKAEQSGVWDGLVAGNAVDGILSDGGNANCAHPEAGSGSPAWWRVDLGAIHAIHNVTVFNTHDAGGAGRMKEFEIGVGNTTNVTEHTLCASYGSPAEAAGGDVTLTCNSPLYGRYVSFRRTGGNQPHLVTICEVVVMGYKQTYAGSETTFTSMTTQVTTETSSLYVTTPTPTTSTSTTTTIMPTTTTTTPTTTTATLSPYSSSITPPVTSSSTISTSPSVSPSSPATSQAPPSFSSTPDMTTSTLLGTQDPTKRNDQHKTIVALSVINALLVIVIAVGLLVYFLQRRRINQQSQMSTTSPAAEDDYENVAMSSSPDAVNTSDKERSAGRADLNVPIQNDPTISSINGADHSGKEQPYETLNNYMEVNGEYSHLNTRPTN